MIIRCRRRARRSSLLVLTVLLATWVPVLPSAASALDEDGSPDPLAAGLSNRERLDALVERVRREQASIDTLSARFRQHKESELLLEPESAEGRFLYQAPDAVRWEYLSPDPSVMTIKGDQMLTYYPDLARAQRVAIGRYTDQIFKYMGLSNSLDTLMKYFSVAADFPDQRGERYHLTLLPRYESLKKRLESMELWIDADSFLPVQLKYTEKAGDVTEYRFEDLELNVVVPAGSFDLDLPPGVEVESVDLRRGD